MQLIRKMTIAALLVLSLNVLSAQNTKTRRKISTLPLPDLEELVMEHTLADVPITTEEREAVFD